MFQRSNVMFTVRDIFTPWCWQFGTWALFITKDVSFTDSFLFIPFMEEQELNDCWNNGLAAECAFVMVGAHLHVKTEFPNVFLTSGQYWWALIGVTRAVLHYKLSWLPHNPSYDSHNMLTHRSIQAQDLYLRIPWRNKLQQKSDRRREEIYILLVLGCVAPAQTLY